MKMKRMLQIGLAVLLFAPFQAWALSLDIDTVLYEDDGYIIDASLLTGTADLTVTAASGGWNLEIILINTTVTGAVSDGGSSVWLTGIGFDLPDELDVSDGTAVLSAGSDLYDHGTWVDTSSTGGDISGDWGYLNGTTGHFNDFSTATDTQVSTMTADVDYAFSDAYREYYDSLYSLNGPPMGLVSGSNELGGGWSIEDGLVFSLYVADLSGFYSAAELESLIQGGEVVLTFGSPNAVPEPSTILLLGVGMIGLGIIKRRLGFGSDRAMKRK